MRFSLMMVLLVLAIGIGFTRLAFGWTVDPGPVVINAMWASYNLAMLSVVLVAATYRPAT